MDKHADGAHVISSTDRVYMRSYESSSNFDVEHSSSSAVFFAFASTQSSLASSIYHVARHISKSIADDAMVDIKSEYIEFRNKEMVTYYRKVIDTLLEILANTKA